MLQEIPTYRVQKRPDSKCSGLAVAEKADARVGCEMTNTYFGATRASLVCSARSLLGGTRVADQAVGYGPVRRIS